jgi:hypothetical protein
MVRLPACYIETREWCRSKLVSNGALCPSLSGVCRDGAGACACACACAGWHWRRHAQARVWYLGATRSRGGVCLGRESSPGRVSVSVSATHGRVLCGLGLDFAGLADPEHVVAAADALAGAVGRGDNSQRTE